MHRVRKSLLRAVLTLAALVTTAGGADAPPSELTLSRADLADWVVVSRPVQNESVAFAASELRRYLRLMTGVEPGRGEPADERPLIVLGLRQDLSESERALLPEAAKGHDGYAVSIKPASTSPVRGPRIIIAGDNPRGLIYGVYDLLERCGCRWFYPTQNPADPEVVPRQEKLTLAAGAWSMASPMKNRICNGAAWFFDMNMAHAAAQLDWAMKNRYNAMGWQANDKDTVPLIGQYEALRNAGLLEALRRRGMFLHGPGHSFQHFLRAADYFDAHPEWFGLRDGKRVPQNFFGAQFCWSNADARKVFVDNLEKFVLACPEIRIVCIVPFDGGGACACAECKQVGPSNAVMMLMREAIERLEHSAPGVQLETVGGYGPLTDPPSNVETHPRQRIIWAHWGRHYGSGYDDPKYGLRTNLETWQRAARGGLTVCQYYTDNFAEPWIMPPFAVAMQGDRRYFLARRIDSVYMLMWSPGYWWNHALNGYLAGRCFYDFTQDPYRLIEDYALNYYGPRASPLIGKYYDQWARVVDLAYSVRGDSTPKHWKMLADQRRDWLEPALDLAKDDPVLAARVGRVEKLHALAERLCQVHRRRYQIQLLRERGQFEEARKRLAEARLFAESTLYHFYALAELDQGLIERKDIGFLIRMRVLDWLDVEAKAIAAQDHRIDKSGPWKELEAADLLPATP